MPSLPDNWRTIIIPTPGSDICYRLAPVAADPDAPCPFASDGRYPADAVGLAIIPTGSVWIGTGKSGLFHYKLPADDSTLDEALADYLRYEHTQDRVPILFGLDTIGGPARVADALASIPPSNVIRPSDPRFFVHSTSRAAGDQIRRDGAIKSWHLLEQEGRPPQWHKLKSSVLGEPPEYAQYVYLGAIGNPWIEVVTASHQAGRFLGPDDCYEPGWRFYFDAHKLILAGMITRLFGCKVHLILPLARFCVCQIDVSAVPACDADRWTPLRFTDLADRAFAEKTSTP